MKLKQFLNQKGQTAMEYLLLLAVAVTIGVAFKKKMEGFLLRNPNSVINQQLNRFTNQFNSDSQGRYRSYSLR